MCGEKVNDLENDDESSDPNFCTAEGKLELETAVHDNLTVYCMCLDSMRVRQSTVDDIQVHILPADQVLAPQQQCRSANIPSPLLVLPLPIRSKIGRGMM